MFLLQVDVLFYKEHLEFHRNIDSLHLNESTVVCDSFFRNFERIFGLFNGFKLKN